MSLFERFKRPLSRAEGPRWSLGVSDEAKMRAASAGLWALVSLAAVGGVTALLRPSPTAPSPLTGAPAESVTDAWAAASFGERFVIAYLAAGPDSDVDLSAFLAETPQLPATRPPQPLDGPVRAVGVEQIESGYWAVTVAAGQPGAERFWRVGVTRSGSRSCSCRTGSQRLAAPRQHRRP